MTKQINVSIIIVHFKVKQLLIDCLESIYKNTKGVIFEIIVVDNDERKTISTDLKRIFPQIIYVPNRNRGFAQGNNIGAKYAKGKYLFFLNPDTRVLENSIKKLYEFLERHEEAGIVSPLLVDKQLKPFKTQSRKELTIKNAIYSFSFLRNFFPKKSIYNDPFFKKWDNKQAIEVETVPGAALMIPKKLFSRIKGFDEDFFLYFEENDISKRIRNLGYHLYVDPKSKIIHLVGKSTKNLEDAGKIFRKSRFYYLKKNYGLSKALLTEYVLKISNYSVLLTLIIVLGFFLRIFNLQQGMVFIGDQGWFYLSARDIFLSGKIPLVGITSSHTWIHQGALWTYLLAPVLYIFKFNPVSGAYLSAIIDIFAIGLFYKIGSDFFSKRIGLISSLVYATSPLVIMNSRMPYHTSPIPFCTLLLIFFILKWINGNRIYFPMVLFMMSILYNFELATVVFWSVIVYLLLFGYFRKKQWALMSKKFILISIVALLAPMTPIILYDFYNGYAQTLKYALWFAYKGAQFIGFFHPNTAEYTYIQVVNFFLESYSKLIFISSFYVSLFLLIISFGYVFREAIVHKKLTSLTIVGGIIITGMLGYLLSKTPSAAYLPMLFPGLIIILVLFLDKLFLKSKIIFFILFFLILSSNTFSVITNTIYNGSDFKIRMKTANKILRLAGARNYNLKTLGPGSEFKSSTMNYEYLTWWLGHGPSNKDEKLKLYVSEPSGTIRAEIKEK